MSEHQLAVLGTVVVYIAVFAFLAFLVLWALDCWWRVYQVIKGIGPLTKFVNKNLEKIMASNERRQGDE